MTSLKLTVKKAIVGMASLLVVAGAGSAFAADLYSLPTEDGLELFLLDNHIQSPILNLHRDTGTTLTVGQDGALTFTRRDSLADQFGLPDTWKPSQPSVGYQGFRISPFGRVLSVEGRFQPDLGPATVETANSGQAVERRFDFGTSASERAGWENGQGMRILSF